MIPVIAILKKSNLQNKLNKKYRVLQPFSPNEETKLTKKRDIVYISIERFKIIKIILNKYSSKNIFGSEKFSG